MLEREHLVERRIKSASRGSDGALGGITKRSFDILMAVTAIAFLWPLMLMSMAAIRITSPGGPLIFGHERIGFGGRKFRCLKIRTMVVNAEAVLRDLLQSDPGAAREWAETQKLRNDPRVTKIGKLLRQTSLDELPQLWNVLVGDMSIVGPRPIVSAEARRYAGNFPAYIATRPGITGLWQVMGRSDCTYEERVSFDIAYIRGWSILKDFSIILRTMYVVVSRAGSY